MLRKIRLTHSKPSTDCNRAKDRFVQLKMGTILVDFRRRRSAWPKKRLRFTEREWLCLGARLLARDETCWTGIDQVPCNRGSCSSGVEASPANGQGSECARAARGWPASVCAGARLVLIMRSGSLQPMRL